MKTEEQDKKRTILMDLNREDAFIFSGDVKKEVYYYVKQDGMYCSVVDKLSDIDNASKWAFVSTHSVVMKQDG